MHIEAMPRCGQRPRTGLNLQRGLSRQVQRWLSCPSTIDCVQTCTDLASCGRQVSADRKAKLIVIEKVLFSMAKACAKSEHVPMIMLQAIAGGAAAQSVVVMFAELWKKDPPEISIICCALGESLSAGSLVALRDPAFRVLDDVFTTARGLSLAL